MTAADSTVPDCIVEGVLQKLGLSAPPPLDLYGLNDLYRAWCAAVPFDNVRKRIWFASDRKTPLPGGNAADFFENWLLHGTGGTCWPANGALFALVDALGYEARRVAGSMITRGRTGQRGTHGSVIVTVDGTDYLVDASILSFQPLPLVVGVPAVAGPGIHRIHSVVTGSGFDIVWYTGYARDTPICFRPDPEYDSVDHAFFVNGYERSKHHGPFNRALSVCRRYPDAIISIQRDDLTTVAANGGVTIRRLDAVQRTDWLVGKLGFSEQIIRQLPPDDPPEE